MPIDIDELLARLSREQKAALTAGADLWRTTAVPEAGIPQLKVTDGPIGARGDLTSGATSTCFPCGAALGATWDVELAERVGAALAEETKAKGAHVLLGPTVNLHRHPLAGRNFECYSEDPELTARVASAWIRGLQAGGVGSSIKHYVANDQEHERMTISSQVDERTLRELYLRPFEAAVAEADPWIVMAAYNRINGVYATEHRELLIDVLKREWGWAGVVISDWYATHDTERAAMGGTDLEMPGPPAQLGPKLAEAAAAGVVTDEAVDEMARRMLHLLDRAGRFDDPELQPERTEETEPRRALAREVASSAIVLLRNDGTLPLDASSITRLAVLGPAAHPGFDQGGGSAQVQSHRRVSPLDGLQAALPGVEIAHARGCAPGAIVPPVRPDLLGDGWAAAVWTNAEGAGEPVHLGTWTDARYSHFGGRKLKGVDRPAPLRIELRATLTADQTGPWTFHLACVGRTSVVIDGKEQMAHDEDGPQLIVLPTALPRYEAVVELEAGRPVQIAITLTATSRRCFPHLAFGATPPDPHAEIAAAAALA
ncbi:MAG: beta-glucosidase, partial [Acidimicrobiaceae bacterium]